MEIKLVQVDGLTRYARNARTHSPEQLGQIKASMLEFGWTNPILADMSAGGSIVAGHGRLSSAQELFKSGVAIKLPSGETLPAGMVPVIDCAGWTDAQRRAYVLVDNKTAINAGWDEEMLRLELAALEDDGFDLDLTGFSEDEIAGLSADGSSAEGDDKFSGLIDRFMIAPFSVLNAREGWWQDRKRAWIAFGIKSELGRGGDSGGADVGRLSGSDRVRAELLPEAKRAKASPGGSMMPAADYSKTKARGNGRGQAV